MKRCPECLFIYPESDERCDFDKTPLVVVNDAEIDAAVKAPVKSSAKSKPRNRRFLSIAGTAAVALVIIVFLVYLGFNRAKQQSVQASTDIPSPSTPETPHQPSASPSPSPSVSPSPSPTPTPNPSPRIATSHSRTSVDPVSTSGPGMGSRRGGKPVIVLTSGARIEADEVWRTRDGFWYRKNGMVTLLKHGQVKAIVSR